MRPQSTEERLIWRRCFWAGVLTLILGAIVLAIFPSEGGNYPPGYGTPIIALEFAQNLTEGQTVINYGPSETWLEYRDAMQMGTLADMPFLLVYGFFMVSYFHAAKIQTQNNLFKFFAAIAVIASLADACENFYIFDFLLGPKMRTGGTDATLWHYFAKAKFMALGLVGLGAAVFLLRQPRILRKIEGVFAGLGGALTLFALTRPEQMGDMLGLGVTLSWIAMLAYAATQAFKKSTP